MNLATIISENFNAILATVSSLAGVSLGSLFTSVNQKKSFERQTEWERTKKEEEKLEKVISIYNKVLEIDGMEEIIDYNQGRNIEFKPDDYGEKIRPILYEKFHLLHSDIANYIKDIDDQIKKWRVFEEAEEEETSAISTIYTHLIDKIKGYVESQRVK